MEKKLITRTRVAMTDKYDGIFSANLFSLQLQIKTLLEGAGGDHALELLDSLCTLNKSEQKVLLRLFQRCTQKVAASEHRLSLAEDQELKAFEESLYQEIERAMHESAASERGLPSRRFAVVSGGKTARSSQASYGYKKPPKNKRLRAVPTLIN